MAHLVDGLADPVTGLAPEQKLLLSLREASSLLGVSVVALRLWITGGRLPAVRAGRRVMLRRTELDARIASGQLLDPVQK
jgi:excisionase family DNA binding protein